MWSQMNVVSNECGLNSGVATQYTALGFLHEIPPPLNTVVKAE